MWVCLPCDVAVPFCGDAPPPEMMGERDVVIAATKAACLTYCGWGGAATLEHAWLTVEETEELGARACVQQEGRVCHCAAWHAAAAAAAAAAEMGVLFA